MTFFERLTDASNNLIDFSRSASLFFSEHRYSTKEILERGFVITSMAVSGSLLIDFYAKTHHC